MHLRVVWFVVAAVVVGGGVPLALASSAASSSFVLVVSTTSDAVNGTVSSPGALIAHPGPDGISLREAIMAADKASGRVGITFAPALAGKTISPTSDLPALTHDDTAIVGTTTAGGQPAVTLDASLTKGCCGGLVAVFASAVTISHLRVVGVHGDEIAVAVRAGEPGGELSVHDVRVESNVLDNGGKFGVGLWIGTDFPGNLVRSSGLYAGATGASLADVTVAHNVIRGFTDDGINVGLPGTRCSIQGLTIEDNTFGDDNGAGSPTIELDTNFSNNSITGTRIVRNTFTGDWAGVALNGGVGGVNQGSGTPIPASGNVISGTVISQNDFEGNDSGILFSGGAAAANATGNAVLDTEISNNVFARSAPYAAVGIAGGGQGASGNRVDGVSIVNDTIAFNGSGIAIDTGRAFGNQISNVDVQNTIFWGNGRDLTGPDASSAPPTIRSSLMGTDPRFVSAQDFHLQAGSPAIDAGASDGAPAVDFEDRARVGPPDIGAYEFGAALRPGLDVDVEELGGTGMVTSSPAGISCETTCDAAFNVGTAVMLSAAPAAGSRFASWSGACSGVGVCTVTLNAATSVTATFSPPAVKRAPKPKLAPKCKKGQKSTKKKRCRR